MAGIVWLLAPRGVPGRWVGAVALLPAVSLLPPAPRAGTLELTVLDVGQGLAVVLRTANHALLYDTGPRFGTDADSGSRILLPHLRAAGVRALDGLVVSHEDNDHAGGAGSVLDGMPVSWLLSSLPEGHALLGAGPRALRCVAGQSWEWDGVRFTVLHPGANAYDAQRKGNDRGCVLMARAGQQAVLIAADIEARAERELLARSGADLQAAVLVVPHHGSRTSSTPEFVQAVNPRWAVFTVGYRNRFGHPKPEVAERYRKHGSALLRTDEAGAIRFMLAPDASPAPVLYRKENPRYWRS
jgi:competence protein ComEC